MNSPSAPLVGKYHRGGPRAPLRNFGPVERRLPMGDASVREDLGQYQTIIRLKLDWLRVTLLSS